MERIENTFNNYAIVAGIFVVAVTFLPSRCLATIVRYIYRHVD
jgi:hypothetical protein